VTGRFLVRDSRMAKKTAKKAAKGRTSARPAAAKRSAAERSTAKRSAAKRSTAKRPAAKRSAGAKSTAARGAKARRAAPKRAAEMFQKVAFSMFSVQDAARARAFYEDVLGLRRGLGSPDGTWTEYDLPGGGCLALFRHPDPSAMTRGSGGASVALEVADLDALNERLAAAGVAYQGGMIHGPNCRMSNILDSEGNAIILHELARR
jgi:predicted enzyme related to lactoylglutathione lyase